MIPDNSDYPIPEDEASEPEETQVDEEEFDTLDESPISFRTS